MEIAIPVIALGAMYVISNQKTPISHPKAPAGPNSRAPSDGTWWVLPPWR